MSRVAKKRVVVVKTKFYGLALVMLAWLLPLQAGAESLREYLVLSPETAVVTPIDQHNTYVVPGGMADSLIWDMTSYALERGGTPEVLVDRVDGFTHLKEVKWVPVDLYQDRGNSGYYYNHPLTGSQTPFHYGSYAGVKEAKANKEFPPLVRMKGFFSLNLREQGRPIGGRGRLFYTSVESLMITHDRPQPFAYKDKFLPEQRELLEPPADREDVTGWTFREPGEYPGWMAAWKTLEKIGIKHMTMYDSITYTPRPEQEAPYGVKVPARAFFTGFGGICANRGGEIKMLLRDGDGLFINPGARRIYGHFITEGRTWGTDFYLSCEGGIRDFAVNIQTRGSRKGETSYVVHYRDNATVSQILDQVPVAEKLHQVKIRQEILFNRAFGAAMMDMHSVHKLPLHPDALKYVPAIAEKRAREKRIAEINAIAEELAEKVWASQQTETIRRNGFVYTGTIKKSDLHGVPCDVVNIKETKQTPGGEDLWGTKTVSKCGSGWGFEGEVRDLRIEPIRLFTEIGEVSVTDLLTTGPR